MTTDGERHSVWHAVERDGNVLDSLVQWRRNKHAAKKFFWKRLKGLAYVPRVTITDKRKSYGAAKARFFLESSTVSIGISTTARRTPINPPASESDGLQGARDGRPPQLG